MNNRRRKELDSLVLFRLADAAALLSDALSDLEALSDEERETFENMPEGLQQSENGQRCEEAADALADAFGELDSLVDTLDEVVNTIETAKGA